MAYVRMVTVRGDASRDQCRDLNNSTFPFGADHGPSLPMNTTLTISAVRNGVQKPVDAKPRRDPRDEPDHRGIQHEQEEAERPRS
jgi:hypothetical protein